MTRGMSVDPVDAGRSHRLVEAKRLASKLTGMLQLTGTVVRNEHARLTWDGLAWLVYDDILHLIYAGGDLSAATDAFIIESAVA